MADAKISALDNLTSADPANDMIPIVDVSATPPASGNTKRISINNLLACSPTATLASATITGDLTVDTSTLKVDSTNNRVGIGTATPSVQLHLAGTDTTNVLFAGVTKGIRFVQSASTSLITGVDNTGAASYQPLSIGGSALDFSLSGTTAMTLNSTGLGIGGSPNTGFLTVGSTSNVSATANALTILSQRATFVVTANGATDAAGTTINYAWASGGQGPLIFRNAAIANVMTLDATGNVGIGVSTFGTSAAKVLSIGTGTEPTTGPAGSVQFFTSTRSASNTIPAIFTEGSGVTNAAITNTTVTNKIAIKVNGTIYYLLATTSAA